MSLNLAPAERRAAAGARAFRQLVKSEVLKTGGVSRPTHETHTVQRGNMVTRRQVMWSGTFADGVGSRG